MYGMHESGGYIKLYWHISEGKQDLRKLSLDGKIISKPVLKQEGLG
jgi:hypothetical protein